MDNFHESRQVAEEPMLDWISDSLFDLMTWIPAQFKIAESPAFYLIRAMSGLIFIVLVLGILALLPPYWSGVTVKSPACSHQDGTTAVPAEGTSARLRRLLPAVFARSTALCWAVGSTIVCPQVTRATG